MKHASILLVINLLMITPFVEGSESLYLNDTLHVFDISEANHLRLEIANVSRFFHRNILFETLDYKSLKKGNAKEISTDGLYIGISLSPVYVIVTKGNSLEESGFFSKGDEDAIASVVREQALRGEYAQGVQRALRLVARILVSYSQLSHDAKWFSPQNSVAPYPGWQWMAGGLLSALAGGLWFRRWYQLQNTSC